MLHLQSSQVHGQVKASDDLEKAKAAAEPGPSPKSPVDANEGDLALWADFDIDRFSRRFSTMLEGSHREFEEFLGSPADSDACDVATLEDHFKDIVDTHFYPSLLR
jgi:hypothetical protein